jgi:PAS domain S-box-containing protein
MARKRILIVEDEIITAKDIEECLQDNGYAVHAIASSGEEAIKKVKEGNPDLVLMDIMLKGEMDGIETAGQIRSISNIPVVYLTAFSDKNILERAKITEPFGYILKPFNERELHINIEIALYKHKMERELKESERWLASLLKNLGEAVMATDKNGVIKFMNPFAEALTGWKLEDALGKPLITVFNIISEGNDAPIEDPVKKAIREGIFYGLAINSMLITKEGMKIPVDVIGSTIKDDTDSIIGISLIFLDIFERTKMRR